jgi:hypothetical protein
MGAALNKCTTIEQRGVVRFFLWAKNMDAAKDIHKEMLPIWPARPRTQHDCHHDTKVKPEAGTAVTELLMMGGKTPETC